MAVAAIALLFKDAPGSNKLSSRGAVEGCGTDGVCAGDGWVGKRDALKLMLSISSSGDRAERTLGERIVFVSDTIIQFNLTVAQRDLVCNFYVCYL